MQARINACRQDSCENPRDVLIRDLKMKIEEVRQKLHEIGTKKANSAMHH